MICIPNSNRNSPVDPEKAGFDRRADRQTDKPTDRHPRDPIMVPFFTDIGN